MLRLLCVLFFLFSFLLEGVAPKKGICLAMVAHNNRATIQPCLESLRPLIDAYVIIDTGSTDGTKACIMECLKDLEGEIYDRSESSCCLNRNEALSLAQRQREYVLWMSPDEQFVYDASWKAPELSKDVYCIRCEIQGEETLRRRILKSSLPWRWNKAMHQYLSCDVFVTSDVVENCILKAFETAVQEKAEYHTYIALLQKTIQTHPYPTKAIFCLAQTYGLIGDFEKALQWFTQLQNVAQDPQMVFWALLQIANLQELLSYPSQQVIESYARSHRYRPHRVEPVYNLARLYNKQGRYDLAYDCIFQHSKIVQPGQPDVVRIVKWIDDYGLLFEKSICAYYVGHYQESLEACQSLLKKEALPENIRKQVLINMTFPQEKLSCSRNEAVNL